MLIEPTSSRTRKAAVRAPASPQPMPSSRPANGPAGSSSSRPGAPIDSTARRKLEKRTLTPSVPEKCKAAVDRLVRKLPAKDDQKPAPAKPDSEREAKRSAKGLFAKGTKPGPGRPPGRPNKFPMHIKEVIRHLASGALQLEGEKPIQELVVESLINGIKAPPPHSRGYLELYFLYGVGKPKVDGEPLSGAERQIPRIVFLSPPHDPLAKPGDPPKAARILGQIDGPNGEIIDAQTGKIVVPAPPSSATGGDGLGEDEDRLELVPDVPIPCSACRGSGRQRMGFGMRTEPCDECGGTGRML